MDTTFKLPPIGSTADPIYAKLKNRAGSNVGSLVYKYPFAEAVLSFLRDIIAQFNWIVNALWSLGVNTGAL